MGLGISGQRARFRTTALPSAEKAVLQPSDITYLGVVKYPTDVQGAASAYSFGIGISCRRVGGQLRIFSTMMQAGNEHGDLLELNFVAPNLNMSAATKMSVSRAWGNVYADRTVTDANSFYQMGMHWTGDRLIYASAPIYSSADERTIGAVEFNDAAGTSQSFGPWRATCHSKQSNGYFCGIPESRRAALGGHDIMVGGVQTSINSPNTFGHSLHSFDSSISAPADSLYDQSQRSIASTRLMMATINNRMQRAPTWRACSKGSPPYDCTGQWLGDPNGLVSDIDMGAGCAWIETDTKKGIVFTSYMVDAINDANFRATHYNGDSIPHQWYATEGLPCCHGHTALLPGTGPHTPSLVPQFWIYDPELLIDVAAGSRNAFDVANMPSYRHLHLWEKSLGHVPKSIFKSFQLGATYDPVERLIIVKMSDVEYPAPYEVKPLLYVFQVSN